MNGFAAQNLKAGKGAEALTSVETLISRQRSASFGLSSVLNGVTPQ
jgi:hypothetical protein